MDNVAPAGTKRKKVFSLEERLIQAMAFYARDAKVSLDAAADEAFRDLLKKHKRPLTLKDALKESARELPANDPGARVATARPKRR